MLVRSLEIQKVSSSIREREPLANSGSILSALSSHGTIELLLITGASWIMHAYIGFSPLLVSIPLLPHSPMITSQNIEVL